MATHNVDVPQFRGNTADRKTVIDYHVHGPMRNTIINYHEKFEHAQSE